MDALDEDISIAHFSRAGYLGDPKWIVLASRYYSPERKRGLELRGLQKYHVRPLNSSAAQQQVGRHKQKEHHRDHSVHSKEGCV